MVSLKNRFFEKIKFYRFELRHLLVIFAILFSVQVIISYVQKISINRFLVKTQQWYQQDFAERMANLTATSLEMILETALQHQYLNDADNKKIVQAFNIMLTQQLLQHHVQDVCLLLNDGDRIIPIDNGQLLFSYLVENKRQIPPPNQLHATAIRLYERLEDEIRSSERIYSHIEGQQTFHVFVPFVPRGEYHGVMYMQTNPSFNIITSSIIASFNETSMIFSALIFLGLLAMLYISTYTMNERDETQKLLYLEREKKLKENLNLQKEALFAKRIYHTHHKAEKIMGFIKEDLSAISEKNIEEIKYRVTKYANFISRVIYDMKWYDPPIQAIRNPIFRTDMNELIRFIRQHIFLRVAANSDHFRFELDLDDNLPLIPINEFVIWEIVEPLIQNSIDHVKNDFLVIQIKTAHSPAERQSRIIISDNGSGIRPDLLEKDENGIQYLFKENVSTKDEYHKPSGYGCYIAYEIATQRCGWQLTAENLDVGCRFVITIPNY